MKLKYPFYLVHDDEDTGTDETDEEETTDGDEE